MSTKEMLLKRMEVERCIREVMDGDRKDEYKRNAAKEDGGREVH